MKKKPTLNLLLYFLILFIFILVPDIIIAYKAGQPNFILKIIYKILFLFFLTSGALFLTKSYFWTYIIVGVPYLISLCFETIIIIIFSNYSSLDIVKGIFNAVNTEVNEFFSRFYYSFIIPFIIVIYFFILLKKIAPLELPQLKRKTYFIISFVCLLSSYSISYYIMSNTHIYLSLKNKPKYILRQYFLKQHPISIYYRTYEFVVHRNRVRKFKTVKNNFTFEVSNPNDSLSPNLVVLIIGERLRYRNWTINGYKKNTSPNIKSITNLISFSQNHSNANNTANSFPLIITQGTPKEVVKMYSQKTIVSLYKEAGYKTYWISSQENCFNFIDNKFEMDKLYEIYNNPNHTDIDIITTFQEVIKDKSTKNKLIVINMLGGHGSVPNKFKKFKPNSETKKYTLNKENKEIFINDYDNMILMQDYILSELITKLIKTEQRSILLFTADHGTNLFDNKTNSFGYGSSNPTEEETHVPFFIWGSQNYINSSNKFKHLYNNKSMLTTNDNIFHTLADLSYIEYKDYETSKSLADSLYLEPKSRFVLVNDRVFKFKKK